MLACIEPSDVPLSIVRRKAQIYITRPGSSAVIVSMPVTAHVICRDFDE